MSMQTSSETSLLPHPKCHDNVDSWFKATVNHH